MHNSVYQLSAVLMLLRQVCVSNDGWVGKDDSSRHRWAPVCIL